MMGRVSSVQLPPESPDEVKADAGSAAEDGPGAALLTASGGAGRDGYARDSAKRPSGSPGERAVNQGGTANLFALDESRGLFCL